VNTVPEEWHNFKEKRTEEHWIEELAASHAAGKVMISDVPSPLKTRYSTVKIHDDDIRFLKRMIKVIFPRKDLNLLTSKDPIEIGIDCKPAKVVTNVEAFSREFIDR